MRAWIAAVSPALFAALMVAAPLSAAQPVPAQTPTQPTAVKPTAAAAAEVGDKMICRRDKVVGSRLNAKRVCQTAADWERQRREDQQMAERIQSSRT